MLVRFAKNLSFTLLGFLLVLALLPRVPGPLEQRADPLLAERADCGVLFIGPSYVANQIEPDAFNREADRIGLDAHACKFGAPALRGFELRMWLERLLSHDWPRLRLVVVDITLGDEVGFNSENWLKPRVIEWHTLEALPWLMTYYEEREPLPLAKKVPELWAHAKHVGAHYLRIGEGVEGLGFVRIADGLRPKPSEKPRREGRVTDGRNRERVRGAAYRRRIENLRVRRANPRTGPSDWPLELREVVRAHKKEAYFLIAPVLYNPRTPRRASTGGDRLVLLDFNQPDRFPELYREEVRGNTSHLRGEGPELYSALLAREIQRVERRQQRTR